MKLPYIYIHRPWFFWERANTYTNSSSIFSLNYIWWSEQINSSQP